MRTARYIMAALGFAALVSAGIFMVCALGAMADAGLVK